MRLIATDLDGTLLDSTSSVSPRTRAALDAARARGIHVVPVTARQPIGLRTIAADAAFEGWALCSNGAYAVHLTDGRMLFAEELPAETIRTLAEALRASIPGLLFASVRDAGETFVAEHGYAEIADLTDHKRDPKTMGGVPLDEVVSVPSLKFVIRHPELAPSVLYDALRALDLDGFEATLSGAPFLEVMAEGVTKASGLARLCMHLGIDRGDVIAFGDALNDVEMLRWAGLGVAMGGADDIVQDAADETTSSNDDDGVARVIERILAID
ncbi:Cof subfamily protein (haloacid dehalogenase superfamily) [Microbacterium foliorum]|uniref:Cof-type HAD-IIB family hydrolase n=1 Tax=Microbacterium foliorum TaxID=104336 RepID=UPI00209C8C2B|nr:HAD family hydrolase [Microbacterium foliorum]MCP1428021.1 Cof subfamily protein (haloacid dehalogenase superfamily) [Microbacterium foliorum]